MITISHSIHSVEGETIQLSVHCVEKKAIKGEGELTFLFGRDKNKIKRSVVLHGHKPYFYVNSKSVFSNPDPRIIKVKEKEKGKIFKTPDNKQVYKVIVSNSVDVSGIENKIEGIRDHFDISECFEDDIPYKRRVCIDIGLKNGVEIPDKYKLHWTQVKPCDFYIPLRRIQLDIETLTEEGNKLPDPNIAKQPITVLNCVDSYTKISTTFVFKEGLVKQGYEKVITKTLITPNKTKYEWHIKCYNNELEMFKGFLRYAKYTNSDGLYAWNGDKFDFPYMINRMKRINNGLTNSYYDPLDYRKLSPMDSVYYNNLLGKWIIKGVILFDTQTAYLARQTKTVSGSLEAAGQKVLGYGKLKLGCSFNKAYKSHLGKLIRYNAIDTIIDYEIYEKLRQDSYFGGIRRMVGVDYDQIFHNLPIVERLILNKYKERGWVSPSARGEKIKGKIKGAHVVIPTEYGRIENVGTLDLKSLYPGIIIAFNMGSDTYVGYNLSKEELDRLPFTYIVSPIGTVFRTDRISVVAEILIDFINYRETFKEQLFTLENKKEKLKDLSKKEILELDFEIILLDDTQMVIKFLTNSVYGVFANKYFRFSNKFIAKTITAIGRGLIKLSIQILIHYKIKAIYGDTDSVKFKHNSKNVYKMMDEIEDIGNKLNRYYWNYFHTKYNIDLKILKKYILMKPEAISRTYFITRKKGDKDTAAKKKYSESIIVKYILNKPIVLDKPELDIKGHLKSNISVVGNTIIKKVNLLIHQPKSNDEVRRDIIKYLKAERDKIKDGKYKITDICIRQKASKPFSKYVRKTKSGLEIERKVEHIDAGRYTNQWAKLWDGASNLGENSFIYYIFVDPNKISSKYAKTDKIALDDNNFLPDEFIQYTDEYNNKIVVIDYDRLIDKTILAPLDPILKEININKGDIILKGYVKPFL